MAQRRAYRALEGIRFDGSLILCVSVPVWFNQRLPGTLEDELYREFLRPRDWFAE